MNPHPKMTPEHKGIWLDWQLVRRLERFFRHDVRFLGRRQKADGLPLGVSGGLALWRWEKLCATLLASVRNSLHYREKIGEKCAMALVAETGGKAGRIWLAREPGADRQVSLFDAGEAANVAPHAEKWLNDLLRALPFTSPEDLSANPGSFLAVPHDEVEGIISLPSSGTTGNAKRVFCSAGDLARTAAFFQHGMRYMVNPERDDCVALLMSGDRPGSVGDLLLRAMRSLGVRCEVPGFITPGAAGEDAAIKSLLLIGSTCLVGLPGQLFSLSKHALARTLRLRSVLLSGDTVAESLRRNMEKGFGCPVFIHYGLTECGLGGAVECRERTGCHMREADLAYEIVDGAGRALPPGEWGEVAISTLTREAMPLLRYKTGDEGRIVARTCACGSILRRIELHGRLARRVTLPVGTALHGFELDQLLYALDGVKSYAATIYQGKGGPACGLLLELFISPGADAKTVLGAARTALATVPGLAPLPQNDRALSKETKSGAPYSALAPPFYPEPGAGLLPVLLWAGEQEKDGAAHHPQGKMRFVESREHFSAALFAKNRSGRQSL